MTSNTVTTDYTYDTAGNIVSKVCSAEDSYAFTYGNDDWQDLLAHVEINGYYGSDISYDACKNPFNWYNGSSYIDLTWMTFVSPKLLRDIHITMSPKMVA